MDQDIITEKNISDRWLKNIFESLIKLEEFERNIKHGLILINTFNSTQNQLYVYAQFKAFISEFQILIVNAETLISKENLVKLREEYYRLIIDEIKIGSYIRETNDAIMKKTIYILKPEFEKNIHRISTLRAQLVKSLWKLFNPSAKEDDDMDFPS